MPPVAHVPELPAVWSEDGSRLQALESASNRPLDIEEAAQRLRAAAVRAQAPEEAQS